MNNLLMMVIMVLLCCGCSSAHVEKFERVTVNNPIGIILKSKRALTIDTESAGPIAFYSFDAKKVPPNRRFYLQSNDLMQPGYPPIELISDEYGCLHMAADHSLRLSRVIYPMELLLPGEVQAVLLMSEDRAIVVKTTFVPYPLQAFGSDGAELSVVRTVRDGSRVRCTGAYFNSDEKLELVSKSNDKEILYPIQCYKGSFGLDLMAPNPKSYGCVITLTVKRENGELLTLSYPVGRESFNRDLLCANTSKLTNEDRDKVEEAIECYYKGTPLDALT